MKFLIDAQLPHSLLFLLNRRGHDSIHTRDLPRQNVTTDREVIECALREGRVVVSKDADFLESHLLSNAPEKLIVVRTGNIQNRMLLQFFEDHLDLIRTMLTRSSLIEITQTDIVEHH